MKRHPSIIPLSREHHENLILAQLLKSEVKDYKGMPSSAEDKAKYALACFENGIKDHFQMEEKMLNLLKHYTSLESISKEIVEDHVQLTNLFNALNTSNISTKQLDELGHLLYNHIRKEDRVLFPMIESLCNELEFQQIELLMHSKQ